PPSPPTVKPPPGRSLWRRDLKIDCAHSFAQRRRSSGYTAAKIESQGQGVRPVPDSQFSLWVRQQITKCDFAMNLAQDGAASSAWHLMRLRRVPAAVLKYALSPAHLGGPMLFSEKMNTGINQQIGHEFGASLQYVSIASYFDREGLPELAAHFYQQAEEERAHAMRFVHFVADAGGSVAIPAIAAPKHNFVSAE